MMGKNNYQDWTKEDLIQEIKRLKKRKKYGLVWDEEKTKERFEADAEGKLPVLVEDRKKEIMSDTNKPVNILIEGDNYHALSVLNYTHPKSIDVIYFDPPYNKGNVNVPATLSITITLWMQKILIDTANGFHLCKKSLALAKNLLKNTGLIFISIDDTEMAELKLLMDEIFSEQNFLATLIWRGMHTVRNSSKDFNHNTEYILTYAKNKSILIESGKANTYLRIDRDKTASYPHDDNDGKGQYKLDPIYARNFYTPYEIVFPNGVKWSAQRGNYPRYSKRYIVRNVQ